MRLNYYCSTKSCKKINHIIVKSTNRYDLKHEIGEEINERCKHCGSYTKRHINRLHAVANFKIIIGGILLAAVVTLIFWDLGYISTLSATIPIGIWAYENKKISVFNKHLI
jgi:hypothetical protein